MNEDAFYKSVKTEVSRKQKIMSCLLKSAESDMARMSSSNAFHPQGPLDQRVEKHAQSVERTTHIP